jgi:glycosyltransferase involved in cell wall biosynthesis
MKRSSRPSLAKTRAPLVSVIMPVFNGERWLGAALDSALAQSFRSFEIVVVNDGSTDTSLPIAQERAERAPGMIRIINQPNAGLPAARNSALAQARGQYLALLDADDLWRSDHLERIMTEFERDPDLGLVHANIERIDADGRRIDIPRRCWSQLADAFEALALRLEHVSCPTAVFSRVAVETVGGFDPDFTGLGCEDRDLWLRIATRFRIHYLDRVTASYRVHRASMSANRDRMARARQLLIVKLTRSSRGARLLSRMEAMLASDLGLEYLEQAQHRQAISHQWAALRLEPTDPLIRRRLARAVVHAIRAGFQIRRWRTEQGGAS